MRQCRQPPRHSLVVMPCQRRPPGRMGTTVGTAEYRPGEWRQQDRMYALAKADIFNLLCIPPYTPTATDNASWSDAAKYCQDRRAPDRRCADSLDRDECAGNVSDWE